MLPFIVFVYFRKIYTNSIRNAYINQLRIEKKMFKIVYYCFKDIYYDRLYYDTNCKLFMLLIYILTKKCLSFQLVYEVLLIFVKVIFVIIYYCF